MTVAAFAVCGQPQKGSYVSKLPTSLLVVVHAWLIASRKKRTPEICERPPGLPLPSSRGDGIRTHDLCVPNAALYQTEPRLAISKNYHTQYMGQSQALICSFSEPAIVCRVRIFHRETRMYFDNKVKNCLPPGAMYYNGVVPINRRLGLTGNCFCSPKKDRVIRLLPPSVRSGKSL